MKSKVHPRYKTKYRVANWAAYNQALVRRGDVMVWVSSEAIAAWTPGRSGRRGGQRRYSDLAIETALTLRLLCVSNSQFSRGCPATGRAGGRERQGTRGVRRSPGGGDSPASGRGSRARCRASPSGRRGCTCGGGPGLAIDGAGGRPGGAPGELVLADLIRGQRGGPRLAAEEGDEMGDPAAGGALGPELLDLPAGHNRAHKPRPGQCLR